MGHLGSTSAGYDAPVFRANTTLAALVAIAWCGCIDTALPTPPGPPMPDGGTAAWCFVLPEVIDFGEVELDGLGLQHFTATNTSGERQRLSVGAVDFPFTGALTRETVTPSGDADVLFTFRPVDSLAHVTRTTFVGGNGCPEQRVELRAVGGGSLTAPQSLDFGPLEFNVPATRSLRLFNTRRFPLEVDLVDGDRNPTFTITTPHVTVPATGSIDVEFGFTATLAGPAQTTVFIDSSAGDRLSVVVTAMGGLPIASVGPTSFDIPRMPIDNPNFVRTLEVFNTGVGDLEVSEVRLFLADGGSTSEATAFSFRTFVSPDASVPLSMQFIPRSAGTRDWVARISTSDPVRPVLTVPIHAVVEDIAPCPASFTVPRNLTVMAPMTTATVEVGFDNTLGTIDCLVDNPHVQFGDQRLGQPVLLEPETQFVVPAGARVVRTLRVSLPGFFNFVYHPIGLGTQASFIEVQ